MSRISSVESGMAQSVLARLQRAVPLTARVGPHNEGPFLGVTLKLA